MESCAMLIPDDFDVNASDVLMKNVMFTNNLHFYLVRDKKEFQYLTEEKLVLGHWKVAVNRAAYNMTITQVG